MQCMYQEAIQRAIGKSESGTSAGERSPTGYRCTTQQVQTGPLRSCCNQNNASVGRPDTSACRCWQHKQYIACCINACGTMVTISEKATAVSCMLQTYPPMRRSSLAVGQHLCIHKSVCTCVVPSTVFLTAPFSLKTTILFWAALLLRFRATQILQTEKLCFSQVVLMPSGVDGSKSICRCRGSHCPSCSFRDPHVLMTHHAGEEACCWGAAS